MTYDKDKLTLQVQPMAGPRQWVYYDTGGESVVTYEGAGFFTDAKDRGVDTGDPIWIQTGALSNDVAGVTYHGRFTTVQDTGGTSGTVTFDTGPDIPG